MVKSKNSRAACILGISFITALASAFSIEVTTSKMYDNDVAVFGKIDRIYEYLGINKNSKKKIALNS